MSASTKSGLMVSVATHLQAAKQPPTIAVTLGFILLDYIPQDQIGSVPVVTSKST